MIDGLSHRAFHDLDGRIHDECTRAAFVRLTTGMRDIGGFGLRPNIKGQKKALHFTSGRVSYFAFIANNSWLLWYFRYPGFRDGVFSWNTLDTNFPNIQTSKRKDPDKAEGILRISSVAQAQDILKYVARLPIVAKGLAPRDS